MNKTFIQMRNDRTTFLDLKTNKVYRIEKIISEHNINHIRVLLMVSNDGKHKPQYSDYFFDFLLQTKQLIIQ
jgi:hypothetical protein